LLALQERRVGPLIGPIIHHDCEGYTPLHALPRRT
jgi:hypothetical protein